MAKRIVDEEMRFSIVVNGNEAQKELFELEKSTRDLTQSTKELKAEKARLEAQGKKGTAEYKKVTAAIKENNATLKANKNRMSLLQKEIGITGLTMRQLSQRASQLSLQLHNMVPGSAEHKRLQAELKAISARMSELKMNARATKTSIGSIADGFNRYAALGASIIATGTGVVLSLQKMIDYNGKLSDSQADVMKTTGMTKDEVDELTKSFGMMKTRTARIELLKLAEDAGRLGITGVKNLRNYVEEANKLKVALGDDLSEEQIKEVGKMTNIYEVGTQTGRDFAGSMLSLGSAINEVSASGANAAPFLVDYLKRQAGIAKQAKLSADQNIGYAATFDEIGQSVEISATAMNKVWMDLFDDTGTYAKIAGMNLKDFNNLLQTDSNEAMLRFLEGLNGNNEGLSVMVEKLKDLDVGGARGAQALSALAGSTDKVRERQAQANVALKEATSLTEEYNLKNNNLAATLEKIQKQMVGWFTSDTIIKGLAGLVDWFAKFIGATEDTQGGVTKFRNALIFLVKLITVVTAALVTNVAWLKLVTLWEGRATKGTILYTAAQKAKVIATEAAFAASQLYAAATMFLTGNIKGATQAIRVMAATMKTTPWGLVLGLVSAVATAYWMYSDNISDAEKAQKNFNEVQKEAAMNVAKEKVQLQNLLRIAQDETASKEQRRRAIDKLNKISPEYLGNLSLENIRTKEATVAIDQYIKALDRKALAQALESKQVDLQKKLVEEQLKSLDDYKSWMEKAGDNTVGAAFDFIFGKTKDLNIKTREELEDYIKSARIGEATAEALREGYDPYFLKKEKQVKQIQKEIENLNKLFGDKLKAGDIEPDAETNEPKEGETKIVGDQLYRYTGGKWVAVKTPTGGDPDNSADNLKKRQQELKRIQEENNRLRASLIDDAFKQELALEDANHEAKIAKLKEQMIEEAELKGMSPEAQAIAIQTNKALNSQIELEEEIHQNNIGAILQKAFKDQFTQEQDQYERERVQREIDHNLELAALGNNEEAKKRLQDKYNREEAAREAKHLEGLISKMKSIMSSGDFKGFELELLSDEQKQELLDFLDKAGLKLSELLNMTNGGGSDPEGPSATGDFASNVDILGMHPDQWISMFDNLDTTAGKIEAAQFAVQTLLNAWSMYNDFMNKREQMELRDFETAQKKKEESLKRQLDSGYINERQYNMAVTAMEKEADKKRAELEYKQAKREREMSMAAAISGTALAVINALQTKPFVPLGLIMAGIATAMGAAQVAMIAKTPLPAKGYEDGLYPVRRQQDGKVFNAEFGGETRSGLVSKPTMFLAGERRKPEMVIDDRAWAKMDPDVKNSVYRELGRMGRVPGYEGGYYPEMRPVESSETSTSASVDYQLVVAALNRNSAVMERLEKTGLPAYLVRNMENAKKMQDDINDYNKLRNANKK